MGARLNDEELVKLKNYQLGILKDIIEVCNMNNLNYFIIAGTLIGTIRHQGFIPWDDDIDIAMTRKDYNKLNEIVSKTMSSKYFMQDYNSESQYYHAFAKLRQNGTLYDEESIKHLNIHKGIFVDIFILDDLKKNDGLFYHIKANMIKVLGDLISYKYVISGNVDNQNSTLKQKLILIIVSILPSKLLKKMQMFLMQTNYQKGDFLVNFGCQYGYVKQTFLTEDYFPPRIKTFEGVDVSVPNNYDEMLTRIYGDYMTIPKEEDRISHSPSRVEF